MSRDAEQDSAAAARSGALDAVVVVEVPTRHIVLVNEQAERIFGVPRDSMLGESIGDLAGAKIAYRAYQKSREGKGPEPTIDGFTPEQRFFVGYGQSWCAHTRDETIRMYATIDPHSPERYRTNGVVSNMPEFQEAFHCKAGSPMVNQNRCRVW